MNSTLSARATHSRLQRSHCAPVTLALVALLGASACAPKRTALEPPPLPDCETSMSNADPALQATPYEADDSSTTSFPIECVTTGLHMTCTAELPVPIRFEGADARLRLHQVTRTSLWGRGSESEGWGVLSCEGADCDAVGEALGGLPCVIVANEP